MKMKDHEFLFIPLNVVFDIRRVCSHFSERH